MKQAFLISGIMFSVPLLLTGCAHRARAPVPPAGPAPRVEVGVASWYGLPHHGRRTANGETYNMEAMTAAHRTLPFGTRVRVRNLANGRAVVVRINDRGPVDPHRILDLSRAAARQLGMLGSGIARVQIVVIDLPR